MPKTEYRFRFSGGAKSNHRSGPIQTSEITYLNNTLTSKRSVSNCEPYREVIELRLNRGRNAMAIWQDLVTEHGFERGYQSVKPVCFALVSRGGELTCWIVVYTITANWT